MFALLPEADGTVWAAQWGASLAHVTYTGEPPVFDIIFTESTIVDYRATLTADRRRIALFNEECLRRGVVKAVNKIYVSLAHSEQDVEETIAVFDAALAAVAARTM